MSLRAAVVWVFLGTLAGCSLGQHGKTYDRGLSEARTILLATELPFPLQGTRFAGVKAKQLEDGPVEIVLVDADGKSQLRFVAGVADAGGGRTRVAVSYAGNGGADPALATRMSEHPEINALFLKTMTEQVDSELEGRPFNNLAIGPEMSAAFAANADSIRADMQAAGDEAERRDRENIDKAYADEARGQ